MAADASLADLLRGLLARDPAARLGGVPDESVAAEGGSFAPLAQAAEHVAGHAWFHGFDWDALDRQQVCTVAVRSPPPPPAHTHAHTP